jgi:hypothetical protein
MVFLKWNEFLPDPNHGFYIPSGVVSTLLPSKTKSKYILRSLHSFSSLVLIIKMLLLSLSSSSDGFVRLYSESLLVNLPTPDFSMPFNVICLGCTAIAIAFGGLYNLTAKDSKFGEKRPKVVFRQRLEDLRCREWLLDMHLHNICSENDHNSNKNNNENMQTKNAQICVFFCCTW